jgi:hypothetical protein
MPLHALELASKAGGERWRNGAWMNLFDLVLLQERNYYGVLAYQNECAQALIRAGNRWAVNPQLELIDNLGKLTGEDNVELDKTIISYRNHNVFCFCS